MLIVIYWLFKIGNFIYKFKFKFKKANKNLTRGLDCAILSLESIRGYAI